MLTSPAKAEITDGDITDAKEYIRRYDSHPDFLGIEGLAGCCAKISRTSESDCSLMLTLRSKFVDSKNGSWEPCSPDKEQVISKELVFAFAQNKRRERILRFEYNTLPTRELRHDFILAYMVSPTTNCRVLKLDRQSPDSLKRLIQSLERYEDDRIKGLIPEVQGVMNSKELAQSMSIRRGQTFKA